ncbi:MAG: glycoside hydrolase, partial [Actinomycetota bacterium]|nr:glycoside hydrolase [Actinomycetota bacterium]
MGPLLAPFWSPVGKHQGYSRRVGRKNLFALVAVVCGLAAVLGAGLLLTSERTTTIGANVLIQGLTRIDAINSPTILHNPTDASNLVAAYRVDRPNYSAALQHSDDGGKTWAATELPLPNGTRQCSATIANKPCPFAPDMAFDRDGKLYVIYVNLVGNGNGPENLWISTSTDGGRTLEPPVRIAGGTGEIFQARMAIAPDKTIHITWLQGGETGNLSLLGVNPIVTVRSTDEGQTWTQPQVISDSGRDRVGAASPAVDGDGNVTVLYEDFKGDRRDFENLEGPVFEDPFALVVTRSTDGGRTWTRGMELESGVIPTRRFLVYLPEFPSLAASEDGTIYTSWMDGRNGDEDVFLKRSSDGGRTWSAPIRVNDNPVRDGTNQYLPMVAASIWRVDVLFYDRRRDTRNIMTDATLATSTDGGRTFTNRRVSSESFDSRVGPIVSLTHGTDFGTKLGLESWDNKVVAAWTDTREGTEADGAQDIATSRITLAEDPPFLARWPVILVLFVVGASALLAARREAQKAPEPEAAKEEARA